VSRTWAAARRAEGDDLFCLPVQPPTTSEREVRAMTKAQAVYERIEALTSGGMTKADAFRTLADETGTPVKSLQGAYYGHARKGGSPGRSRTPRETTAADAVASATQALEKALTAIDREVESAKERADEATREYQALKASASTRKQAIAAKIDALKA